MGDTEIGSSTRYISSGLVAAFTCLAIAVSGCSKSDAEKSEKLEKSEKAVEAEKADNGQLDTSRLPRVNGAKEVFASPATSIFTSPNPVTQTADAVEQSLAAAGWQRYVAPNTARASDPNMRMTTLKKGTQALSVFVTVAPAQNNATSVQYAVIPLKTELPFIPEADNIEYSPDRPLLTLMTGEPLDKLLKFYRKELSVRGWSLWPQLQNAKQPNGVIHKHGAFAYYVNDKEPSVILALTAKNAEGGKAKVELKEWPAVVLKNGFAAVPAGRLDVRSLPKLTGATENPARTKSDSLVYSVAGSVEATAAATAKMLASAGWHQYILPSDEPNATLLYFKKEGQGLVVSFTMTNGKADKSSVYYDAQWIYTDLSLPDDASNIVFDEHRPYLNCVTASGVEATLDFYRQELGAAGWVPLSEAVAKERWPNASLGDKVYYIREKQMPIMLSLLQASDGKTGIEIRVAPFALPQTLEAGREYYGLPTPKLIKTAGGTGGDKQHEAHALVPADFDTVLVFYRRELAVRQWKEESDAAVVKPDQAVLKFSSPQGPAILKIGRRYDLTTVSLVQQITQPPMPASEARHATGGSGTNSPGLNVGSLDALLKDAQKMMRDADAMSERTAQAPPTAPKSAGVPLHAAADSKAPVPVPANAEDVKFNADSGQLEFHSAASVPDVAAFYRSAMKDGSWQEGSSVINRPNMVVLNFSKARKSISFTIMQMGPKTNVTAHGSGLKEAVAKSAAAPAAAPTPTSVPSVDDLVAEESGGLPVPKRHTSAGNMRTPFRIELNAVVPLDLIAVLGFYRQELSKRNWKEDGTSSVTVDNAVVTYASPDGPARLKLDHKDGATSVSLLVKKPEAARKGGVLPKPGQGKVIFGNINDAEAVIRFDNKPIRIAPRAGTKAPDGPSLNLPPGKYKYSIKLAGRPTQNDEVEIGADETWGLMAGPGGVLALQAY